MSEAPNLEGQEDKDDEQPQLELTAEKFHDLWDALKTLYIKGNQSGRIYFNKEWPIIAEYLFGQELVGFDTSGAGDKERRNALEAEAEEKQFGLLGLLEEIEDKSAKDGVLQTDYVDKVVQTLGRPISLLVYERKIVNRVIPPSDEERAEEEEKEKEIAAATEIVIDEDIQTDGPINTDPQQAEAKESESENEGGHTTDVQDAGAEAPIPTDMAVDLSGDGKDSAKSGGDVSEGTGGVDHVEPAAEVVPPVAAPEVPPPTQEAPQETAQVTPPVQTPEAASVDQQPESGPAVQTPPPLESQAQPSSPEPATAEMESPPQPPVETTAQQAEETEAAVQPAPQTTTQDTPAQEQKGTSEEVEQRSDKGPPPAAAPASLVQPMFVAPAPSPVNIPPASSPNRVQSMAPEPDPELAKKQKKRNLQTRKRWRQVTRSPSKMTAPA